MTIQDQTKFALNDLNGSQISPYHLMDVENFDTRCFGKGLELVVVVICTKPYEDT